jgi:nitrilase
MTMEILRTKASESGRDQDILVIGIAQIAPVWFKRPGPLKKHAPLRSWWRRRDAASSSSAKPWPPGYPFWIERTGGARFDDPKQKAIFAEYLDQDVVIERGDLEPLQAVARRHGLLIYIGVMERAPDRGGHSLYCSLVYIDADGSSARFTANCSRPRRAHGMGSRRWPWLARARSCPLSRGRPELFRKLDTALTGRSLCAGRRPADRGLARRAAQHPGPDPLHPSRSPRICRVGVGPDAPQDFPADTPTLAEIQASSGPFLANGGSAIALPDGRFLVEPIIDREVLVVAELDHALVRGKRQNFDLAGHYGRPDVTRLTVNRRRQRIADFLDESDI